MMAAVCLQTVAQDEFLTSVAPGNKYALISCSNNIPGYVMYADGEGAIRVGNPDQYSITDPYCQFEFESTDEDGWLYITGRLKNVIVTSNGKNIYPEELENRLSAYEEISEVLVLPDSSTGEESIKAKIFPNLEYITERIGHLPSKEDIAAEVQKAIGEVNKRIPQYKHIKVVEILSAALEKTTTQKIKRFGKNTK